MGKKWFPILVIFVLATLVSFVGSVSVLRAQDMAGSPTPVVDFKAPLEGLGLSIGNGIITDQNFSELLDNQMLGAMWPMNPIKYAIRAAVISGVPANTIVLLLLLPVVAAVIAGARHLLGVRGFGIFLPAALSIVFVAIGPILGIGLFFVIIMITILVRFVFKKAKIRLQYLPRMALMLLFVVAGVLSVVFAAPILSLAQFSNVLIFPVLILILLAEEFSKVQLGKSIRTAVNMTSESLLLALASYFFLTNGYLQRFALLNPEILLLGIAVFDFFLGKFIGLRFREYYRFRKLMKG